MTIQIRQLPQLPVSVAANRLATELVADNLKLYSDEQISKFKQTFTANGIYENLDETTLPFPVFVFDGKYFAKYSDDVALVHAGTEMTTFTMQDLETGE